MSFLITGANGLIGSDLVKILSKNSKVIAIYRKKRNKKINNKNITWVRKDLIKKLKLKYRPKYIINCVIDQSYKKDSKKYIKRNILIVKNIIDYAKKNKVELIFNLSSIDIYGFVQKGAAIETNIPKKQSNYGNLKYMIEKLISNSKCNFFNLRLPGILFFGFKNVTDRPWVNSIIHKLINNKSIKIYNPEQKFNNVTSSIEISRFIIFTIKNKIFNLTLNFASKHPLTIIKIIKHIKKKLNSKSVVKKIYNKKSKGFYISIDKLVKKTKFKPTSTIKLINQFL